MPRKNNVQQRLPYLSNGDLMTVVTGPSIGGKCVVAAIFDLVSLALSLATIPSYWFQTTIYSGANVSEVDYQGALFTRATTPASGSTAATDTVTLNTGIPKTTGDFTLAMFGLASLATFWVAIPLLAGAIRSCCCRSDGGLALGLRSLRRIRTKLMFTLLFQILGTAVFGFYNNGSSTIAQCVSQVGGCPPINGTAGANSIQMYYIGFGTAIAAITFAALACWLSFTMYEDTLHFALTSKASNGGQYHALAVGVFTDADTEDAELSGGSAVVGNPAIGVNMNGPVM